MDMYNAEKNRNRIYIFLPISYRFHREDMLATLLSQFDGVIGSPASNVKCVPSYVAPDLASAIRRDISLTLRQRKGHFPCNYICEWATYSLPSGTGLNAH